MGVILDVVYNHLGPDGNYLPCFSTDFFTDLHETDWGEAINFDGPTRSGARFFIANAGYWISEFHLDGLRLDATQESMTSRRITSWSAMVREVRQRRCGRATIIVAENELQDAKLVRPPDEGGYGMDALWNDDFHHSAMVELTGRNEAYYTDYLGQPQEFISAAKYGYLYQGAMVHMAINGRGTPLFGTFRRKLSLTLSRTMIRLPILPRGDRPHRADRFRASSKP